MEKATARDNFMASVLRGVPSGDKSGIKGKFKVKCFHKNGTLLWQDEFDNLITTVGKNEILDEALAGSAYTAAAYMGLISSVGYTSGPAAGDTMSSHSGWVEAGSASNFPLYTTPRKTCAWSVAASGVKSLSAALSFPIITTGGTVKGSFIVFGSGASSTIANTGGVLMAAGLFSGGDKTVSVGDTLQVSYSVTLT